MVAIGVLVVSDQIRIRRLFNEAIDEQSGLVVLASASTRGVARAKLHSVKPQAVVLDAQMGSNQAMEIVEEFSTQRVVVPVIVCGESSPEGMDRVSELMVAGATDFLFRPQPEGLDASAFRVLQSDLCTKLQHLCADKLDLRPEAKRWKAPPTPVPISKAPAPSDFAPLEVVVIGASAGGPAALSCVLGGLPADFQAPVLIVQHMPPMVTRSLADRLDDICRLRVKEGIDGEFIEPGTAYLAPGHCHMLVARDARGVHIRLSHAPPRNFCRPSINNLFESAAAVFTTGTLAVVLTGMGDDGLEGARSVRKMRGLVYIQDESSSAVWGMPRAVKKDGIADLERPIVQIARAIIRRVNRPTENGNDEH
jgi:two-component system chemotaxis response regulator CheB